MNTPDHPSPSDQTLLPAPSCLLPPCPHCNAANAVHNGGTSTNPQYRCRACGRYYYAHRRPDLTERPCPHCNGPCIKRGFAKNGAQKYKCKACGKMNTDLYPYTPPIEWQKGSGAKILTLYLDVHSHWHLDRYCRATGRNYVQAIRQLLREVGTPKFSGLTHSSLPRLRGAGGPKVTFPDARPQSRKQRIGLPRRQAHKYISLKVTVLLDALCLQGIQSTRDHLAKSTDTNNANKSNAVWATPRGCPASAAQSGPPTHQDAVRYIIRNARLPNTPKPNAAPRHRPNP